MKGLVQLTPTAPASSALTTLKAREISLVKTLVQTELGIICSRQDFLLVREGIDHKNGTKYLPFDQHIVFRYVANDSRVHEVALITSLLATTTGQLESQRNY